MVQAMKVELADCTNYDFYKKLLILTHGTRSNRKEESWHSKKSIEDFTKDLISWGHEGPFEHIKFTFFVSGISRVLTHQLVRHRIASYLQMSNRHSEPLATAYVIPEPLLNNHKAIGMYERMIEQGWDNYKTLQDYGVRREDARYVLPPGYFTHILVTMNGRELRHFFQLRCSKDAQDEIRTLAKKMLIICYGKFPAIYEDLYDKYVLK